jgi:hypothetical protein
MQGSKSVSDEKHGPLIFADERSTHYMLYPIYQLLVGATRSTFYILVRLCLLLSPAI